MKFDQPSTALGKPANLTITAVRKPGFTEEIALTATGLPANVAPALKNIPANMTESKGRAERGRQRAGGNISYRGEWKSEASEYRVLG